MLLIHGIRAVKSQVASKCSKRTALREVIPLT